MTAALVIAFVLLDIPVCWLLSSLFAVIRSGQTVSWENIKEDFWQGAEL
jgi:hypothetical protein